jgi:uncharacterized iron-regulated protein
MKMEKRTQSPIEFTLNRMQDQLKAHESMILSLEALAERQQELLERMAGGNVPVRRSSLLEALDMEKMARIALFAASLYSEEANSDVAGDS